MKKILLLIVPTIFLTGCVSVTVPEDNSCYRYIDYQYKEHYMDYQKNRCFISSGQMACVDGEITRKVVEFEIMECPKENKWKISKK